MKSFIQFLEAADPFLQAAIRTNNGKVYKHKLESDHEDVVEKHGLHGISQKDGFVNHLGKFMNRKQALDFALKHDLLRPSSMHHKYPNGAWDTELDSAHLKTSKYSKEER